MTADDLLSRFAEETGESDQAVSSDYLEQAGELVLNRRYPYATADQLAVASVPERYRGTQLRVAVALWAKRGAEGETSHAEGGVSRNYGGETTALSSVLPYIGPGGVE